MKILTFAGIVPFGRTIFGIPQTYETSSSNLFTYLIQGSRKGVAGTGTSVFAHFYIEGGLWACLFVFAFLGIGFRWMLEKSRSTDDIRWHVALVCLVAVLCISARMMIVGLLIRQVLYPVIYTIVIAYFLRIRLKSKSELPAGGQYLRPVPARTTQ